MRLQRSDLICLLLVAVFAWLGFTVYDAVAQLASFGRGIQDAGAAVESTGDDAAGALRDGFGTAAGAADDAPVVGEEVAEALRAAGESAAGPVEREGAARAAELAEAGRNAEQQALDTARLVGWLTFLVPTALLLGRHVPGRVRETRARASAERLLTAAPMDRRRARAFAARAAFGLPWEVLERHTRDPVGDFIAGNDEPLVAALGAEDAGLRLRRGRRRRAGSGPPRDR